MWRLRSFSSCKFPRQRRQSIFLGPRAVFSESVYARDAFHWAPLYGLREGNNQYIDAPRAELYDLGPDGGERVNLLHKNTAEAQALRIRLARLQSRYAPQAAPERREQPAGTGTAAVLGSLGYLSGSGGQGSKGPDPKDKLAEYRLFEKALEALYSDKPGTAIATFHKLLLGDPKNAMARYYLGESYFRSQRPGEAAREWRAVLAEDPKYRAAADALKRFEATRSGAPR